MSLSAEGRGVGTGPAKRGGSGPTWISRAYGSFFLVAFALTIVMLLTDSNLRTNFGTVSGYYFHWWVVLVTGVADILGAALLLALGSRRAAKGGIVGASLLALIFLGDLLTYQQVGFASASDFAQYLFGVTYYGGDIRYLYDVLLAVYIVTALFGVIVLWSTRPTQRGEGAAAGPDGPR